VYFSMSFAFAVEMLNLRLPAESQDRGCSRIAAGRIAEGGAAAQGGPFGADSALDEARIVGERELAAGEVES